jgi:hypothetical protein
MNQKVKSAVPLWPQKRTQFHIVRDSLPRRSLDEEGSPTDGLDPGEIPSGARSRELKPFIIHVFRVFRKPRHLNSKLKIQNSKLQKLIPLLLNWFSQNARDLPWRRARDPYAIWVSEIMKYKTLNVKQPQREIKILCLDFSKFQRDSLIKAASLF